MRLSTLLPITALLATLAGPARADEGLELFKKIRPVLVAKCYECHSAKSKLLQGGLRLDTRAGLLGGGDSGAAVTPHKPDESLLLEALRYESFEMPPEGRLPATVVADFEKWISLGAPDPRGGSAPKPQAAIDIAAARTQWPFTPPLKPPVPQMDSSWPRTDIDGFILQRLAEAGLTPAEDADRLTLIRRAYFDLTGLPPTPEEIDAFLNDTSDSAFAKVVDQLLESPRFGERWGRHWLDVARFAESSGGGRSLMFPNAWRYRDYVIRSFNQDKPYDVFVTEQLAGDLLPASDDPQVNDDRLIATGYLVLGPINYELQDKELLKMEVIDEQLDTVGRTFMSLTLGCARCHDHKFDPVSTRDYYALAGIFSSTKTLTPGNVSGYVQQTLPSDGDAARRAEHQQQLAAANKQLAAAQKRLQRLQKTELAAGLVVDNEQAVLHGQWKHSTYSSNRVGADYIHDDKKGKGEKRVLFRAQLEQSGRYEVRIAYNHGSSRAPRVPVVVRHADGQSEVMVNQQQRPGVDGLFHSLGTFVFGEQPAEVEVHTTGTDGYHVIVDAVQFVSLADAAQADNRDSEPLRAARQQVNQLDFCVAELKKNAPPEPAQAMSVMEQKQPADGHVHIRGGVRNLGDVVPRGFLSVAMPAGDDGTGVAAAKIPEGASGRLQLARWLTSPDHPLTARVMANRVWHHLTGAGLVATTDNFGAMGQRPTHEELLDYLAVTFREDGWSVKRLVRRIMLSRVYQLSSLASEAQQQADPGNRLLSHARRRRLDAESIRDAMLFVSGRLQTSGGGLTISKIAQYDLAYDFQDITLRSVYVPAFRNSRLELFEVFDAANPNVVSGRRTVSTLPTQALFLMNSPWVMREAQHAARRLIEEEPDAGARIELAYLRFLGRPPSDAERRMARQMLGPDATPQQWGRFCQLLMASLDFRYIY